MDLTKLLAFDHSGTKSFFLDKDGFSNRFQPTIN